MVLKNESGDEDRLQEARSDAAEAVQLHTHLDQDGVMMMRPIEFIVVPAGGSAELQPGGLHIMLIRLTRPLNEGETVPLTLVFERAGEMSLDVPVRTDAP
jgi:copper(I)-binding protein